MGLKHSDNGLWAARPNDSRAKASGPSTLSGSRAWAPLVMPRHPTQSECGWIDQNIRPCWASPHFLELENHCRAISWWILLLRRITALQGNYMNVVMLSITLHHILFSVFNKIQKLKKKKIWQKCGKWIEMGKSLEAGLYQQFRQVISGDQFHLKWERV